MFPMKTKKNVGLSLVAVLLLGFISSFTLAKDSDLTIPFLAFKNGEKVDVRKHYTMAEVKEMVLLEGKDGWTVKGIYQVRGNRPVKQYKVEDQKDLATFNLYNWATGVGVNGQGANSATVNSGFESGDRFAFDAYHQSKATGFSLLIQ
jgi:hypothetical protein